MRLGRSSQRKQGGHIALLSRIHPRKGLRLKRWGPHIAQQVNLLVTLRIVDWEIDSEDDGGMLITLTDRGRRLYYRKRKTD